MKGRILIMKKLRVITAISLLLLTIGMMTTAFANGNKGVTIPSPLKISWGFSLDSFSHEIVDSLSHEIAERHLGEKLLVTINISVSEKGTLNYAEIREGSGDKDIDNAVIIAVKKKKFNPGYVGDKAVSYIHDLPIELNFDNDTGKQEKSSNATQSEESNK